MGRPFDRLAHPLPPAVPNARWIPLGRGFFTLVDEEDYASVCDITWGMDDYGYARTLVRNNNGKAKLLRLHTLILPRTDSSLFVDHINTDKLDNRKSNLRLVTRGQNNANVGPKRGRKYKGTHKIFNRWKAQINKDGKTIHLGMYATEEDAARAYNEAARRFHGEFARLNIVPEESVSTDTSPSEQNTAPNSN
jgi:hypothetical protein